MRASRVAKPRRLGATETAHPGRSGVVESEARPVGSLQYVTRAMSKQTVTDSETVIFSRQLDAAHAATEVFDRPKVGGIGRPPSSAEPEEPREQLVGPELAMARLAWLVPSLLTFAVALVRLTWPGLWADELATWGMATTPWGSMLPLLRDLDGAIGPYYVLMHVLVDLFGASDLVLRLPSAVAMAAAVGITAVIGSRLCGPRVGVLAGLVLLVLPMTSRYAQEARPYALAVFAAALATLLLLRALEHGSVGRYAAYAGAVALVGLMHMVALLILPAHAAIVLVLRRRPPLAWLVSAAAGLWPVVPVLYFSLKQTQQVSLNPPATGVQLAAMPGSLFGLDVLAGIMLALAFLAFSLKRPSVLFSAWAIVPTVLLFVVSQFTSLWLNRYLLFTLPAWALLAAWAMRRAPLIRGAVLVVAMAAIGLPIQLQERTSAGHSQATSALASTLADNEQPGDGIVYSSSEPGGFWVGRDIVAHYVPSDRRPRDVFLVRPQRTDGHAMAGECGDLVACLHDAPRLWTIRHGILSDPIAGLGFDKERLLRERYSLAQTWRFEGLTLALLVQKPDLVIGH
jgi:mannosyltransferase